MRKILRLGIIFFSITTFLFSASNMEEKVTLNLNTTLEKGFNILAKVIEKNIILDQSVPTQTNLNLNVNSMSKKNVFSLVLQLNNLGYQNIDENSLLIYHKSKELSYVEEKTEVYYLNYIKAENMANLIKANIGIMKIYVDSSLNTISVTTSEKNIESIRNIIKSYDDISLYSEKTIFLSYITVEFAQDYLSKLAFINEYNINKELNAITIKGRKTELDKAEELIKKIDVKKSQVVIDILLVDASESLTRTLGFTFGSMFKVIDAKTLFEKILRPETLFASQTNTDAEVLSNPSIRVLNKEKASINIGGRVPIIIAQNVTSTGSSYTVVPQVEYKNVGIILEVTPNIHLDNEVSINLNLEVSSVGGTIETNYGSYPSFNTKNINTTIRLKDGQTAVFGGLIGKEERESKVGVPFLSDIPILGKLFSKSTKNPGKSEVMMFITPRIVNTLANDEKIVSSEGENVK